MYAKKHRPMQKLTAICLSVTIAAASLLSGHVFASDEAPQTDYLTGQELLAELREMGLGQDVILDEEAPESDNSSETNTEDPSDTTGEPGDGDQTDGTEPGNPDEGGSGEGDPDPGESTPEQPGDGDQTGGTEPGNPDEGGSGEGDTDTDTDPGTDNPDNSDPAAGTDPDQGDGTEQGSNQNQPSAPAESTEPASDPAPEEPVVEKVPLVTQEDEDTADVIDPDKPEIPESTEPASDPETPSQPESPSEPSSEPSSEPETPSQPESPSEPSSEPSSEPETPSQPEVPSEPSSEPESSEGELPETSGITEEQRAELAAYVQTLDADQILSLDETNITEVERSDLESMMTGNQLMDVYDLRNQHSQHSQIDPAPIISSDSFLAVPSMMSAMSMMNMLDSGTGTDDGLAFNKWAEANSDGTFDITLEAYTTGTVTAGGAVPTDIVLVLDQSGSMAQGTFSTSEFREETNSIGEFESAWRETWYYYDETRKNYYPVTIETKDNGSWYDRYYTYRASYQIGDQKYYLTGGGGSGYVDEGTQLTLYRHITEKTYHEVLQDSVDTFIKTVRANEATTHAGHRIAIVGFSAGSNNEILSVRNQWGGIGVSRYSNEYDDAVSKALQFADDPILGQAVDALEASGSTNAHVGMEMAKDILNDAVQEGGAGDRNRIVVFFTDGEPNEGNGYDEDVAVETINLAHDIKSLSNTTVYSIGIFKNANPITTNQSGDHQNNVHSATDGNDDTNKMNTYMHYVSSNYPTAHIEWNWWNYRYEEYPGDSANDLTADPPQSYYLAPQDAEDMSGIFEDIASSVTPSIELTEEAVVSDTISQYFQLPDDVNEDNISDHVTVQYVPFNGYDESGNAKWGQPTNADDVTVSLTNDKTIEVTGFNYNGHVVAVMDGQPQGGKLQITFKVEREEDFIGGNNVPTNSEAAVYETGNSPKPVGTADSPTANVSLDYKYAVQDKTIYLSQSQDLEDLINTMEWPLTGWENDYARIVYTVKDAGGSIVGTYTIKKGARYSEGEWQWSELYNDAYKAFRDCTTFTIACEVSASEEADAASVGDDVTAPLIVTLKDNDNQATVHVLKPTLNFHDTQLNGPTDNYSLTRNQKADFITWSDFETGHTNRPDPTQNEPADESIVLTYTWMEKTGTTVTNATVNLTETANFQVNSITINGTTYTVGKGADADYHVTSECTITGIDQTEHTTDRHFTVHLPSEFDLTIEKEKPANYVPGETFRFTVTGPDYFHAQFTLGEYSDGKGTWSITLTGLKPGEYTITEDTGWSWRYETVNATVDGTSQALNNGGFTQDFTEESTVTFTNTKIENHWLSWEDTKVNVFNPAS